jgi:nuclear receptor subfamily 1 group I
LICVVCGSIARGRNFGAITCMSCKVFFRRNAFTNLTDLYCRDEGNCEITEQTRKHCVYCRLLTCFRVGMRKELFRIKEDNDFNRIKIEKQKYRKQLKLPSHLYQITSNNQHMSTTNSTVSSFSICE